MPACKPNHFEICICGAGPVGLLLGNLLGQRGYRVVVLEQRLHRPAQSMAIGITPPSLAILEQLNLVDVFLSQGRAIREASVYEKSEYVGALSFASLPGSYRFILSLPQTETIAILENNLKRFANVTVRRGVRLEQMYQRDEKVELEVWNAFGSCCDMLSADYLIGCDGVHGRVRNQAGIATRRRAYPHHFLMADFDDHSGLDGRACLFFSPVGAVESFPLPMQRRRWVVQLDRLAESRYDEPGLMERLVRQRSDFELSGSRKHGQTHFRVQKMLAQRYFRGRVVLCGDAAHAMSPIGGQGMNTGFADAELLAQALDDIRQGGGNRETLLRDYERRRKTAYRVAAFRAARNMWVGTRRGEVWSELRRHFLRRLLRRSERLRLAEHFAMLTIPGATTNLQVA